MEHTRIMNQSQYACALLLTENHLANTSLTLTAVFELTDLGDPACRS